MAHAGRAWRGWFPLGGELTSGVPDQKEGLYFGAELDDDHPRVSRRTPLHGRNLFPAQPPELRERGARLHGRHDRARSGGARRARVRARARPRRGSPTTSPPTRLILFRIFRYPPSEDRDDGWGVAEHTDYGLLTMLAQDELGGLEVRTPDGWIDAEPIPDSFVCNLGDMLERLTGGRYRSTPHRVRNTSDVGSAVVPVLPRPVMGRGRRAAADRRTARARAARPTVGTTPTCTASPAPTAITSSARWPRCFPILRTHSRHRPPQLRYNRPMGWRGGRYLDHPGPRRSPDSYDQTDERTVLDAGDRMFIPCVGGPTSTTWSRSRLVWKSRSAAGCTSSTMTVHGTIGGTSSYPTSCEPDRVDG